MGHAFVCLLILIAPLMTAHAGSNGNGQPAPASVPADSNWIDQFGNGHGLNDPPYALATDGTTIYVGGSFNTAGTLLNVNNIVAWNGSAWQRMGAGMDGWVRAIAVGSAGVFAGGNFKLADGKEVNGIARWDGTTWQPLGIGVDGEVYAITLSGSDVFVGGRFLNAGGQPAPNIAKWTGSHWEALGTGVDGTVTSIAINGSTLFVSGTFTHAGTIAAKYLAQWTGVQWLSFGSGPDSYVYVLASDGKNIYAGGQFASISGRVANLLAKWDGTTWNTIGNGIAGNSVFAIIANGQDLYVGGELSSAGQTPVQNIAKWDGVRWRALGSGVNGSVRALTASGDNIYVGGSFTLAGANPASYLALWHNAPPVVAAFQVSGFPPAAGVAATDSIVWTITARDAGDSILVSYKNPSLNLRINNSTATPDQWKVAYIDKNGVYIRANVIGADVFRFGVAHVNSFTTLAENIPISISVQDSNGVTGTTPPFIVVPGPVVALDIFPYDAGGRTVKGNSWSGSDGRIDTVFYDTQFPYYIQRYDRYHNLDTLSAATQVSVTSLGSGPVDLGGPSVMVRSMTPTMAKVLTNPPGRFQLIALWNGQYFSSDTIAVPPVDAIAVGENVPSSMSLEQNYPNPFNPTTMIRFQLAAARGVTLKVYDMLGREVRTLVDKKLQAGIYDVLFSGENLPSGVYYYRLSMEGFTATRKMLLLK